MFFTTIEEEATLSGLKIINVFGDVAESIKAVFRNTSGVEYSDDFGAQLSNDVLAIQDYINKIKEGATADDAFAATMRTASQDAQNFVSSLNAVGMTAEQAAAKLAAFETQQKMGVITTTAQDKSLGNVRTLLNEYNSGLANCGLTQEQFIQSVSKSNHNLGYYLTNLQGGEATMHGYVGTLISAKLATIGLRISTMALNAVIGMGIGLVISLVSSGIMKLIEYAKENARPLAEKLADVNSGLKEIAQNIKDISDEYRDLKASTDEIIPRFAELADGVDRFGKNVSLTDDEYSEFLSLNNKIAEMFPELNLGMDDSGNAMLNLAYNADTLTESLNQLVEAQREAANQQLVDNLPDLVSGVKDKNKLLTIGKMQKKKAY